MHLDQQITTLEAHLAAHPDDARTRYHLGLLLAEHHHDPAAGRKHLLQWLLDQIGHSDPAEAEQRLRTAVDRDRDPRSQLMLGHLLGYLGRADEADTELQRATRWQTRTTPHFELCTVPGSTASSELDTIAATREAGLQTIEALFGLGPDPGLRIRYYLYETELHKHALTGDPMPAHAFCDRAEIHAVVGPATRVDSIHEDVHIVLRRLGRPCRFLEEGAAIFAEHGPEVHAWFAAATRNQPAPALSTLLDDETFDASDLWVTYPMAGSFVAFLMAELGRRRFLELYPTAGDQVPARTRRMTGLSLDALEARWLAAARVRVRSDTAGASGAADA